jgi:hypothetical protein
MTNLVQQGRIDRGICGMMKDCNFTLPSVFCVSFNTESMTTYQHLTNLDFVRDASSCHTNFGRITIADTRYPHLQLFCRLTTEFFQQGRLRGTSSDNHFAYFNTPNLGLGLEVHKKIIDPWFVSLRNLRFPVTDDLIDHLQVLDRLTFIFKTSQDPAMSEPLVKEMVRCVEDLRRF